MAIVWAYSLAMPQPKRGATGETMNTKQQHTPDAGTLREIGAILDRPGSFGRAAAYFKALESERDALRAENARLREALTRSADLMGAYIADDACGTMLRGMAEQARAALAGKVD